MSRIINQLVSCIIEIAYLKSSFETWFLEPAVQDQQPVTSKGVNQTILRYLESYAREHLGKPPCSNETLFAANVSMFIICSFLGKGGGGGRGLTL